MSTQHVPLQPGPNLWERVFLVAPLVVVATREEDGRVDLAPKHLASPLSWEDHYGFVCTPAHATYRNAQREGWFTVSFPGPDQVLLASLAAAPRQEDGAKPSLSAIPTVPARALPEGVVLRDAVLRLECELDRVVDGFGANSLICGKVVAASADPAALRDPELDDQDLLRRRPPLAYLHPGRFAALERTFSFPYHAGWSR
jgi:flavin reductase (DIM6/NTAB) family NADH-FMN oxidoreductase RutF